MAAVTAAVIGATATVAAGAMSSGVMGGGSSGGGGGPQDYKKVPEDPQDAALKADDARLTVANANTRYPSCAELTQSGGDAARAEMKVNYPDLKPSEAAALGFVGGRGEPMPGVGLEDVTSGKASEEGLTTEQRIFLAEERRRQAAAQGQEPGPWAGRVGKLGKRHERIEQRLQKLSDIPEAERTPGQERRFERLGVRHQRVTERYQKALGEGSEIEHKYPLG